MNEDATVSLIEPQPVFLATVEQFALLLSVLRRKIPRLHYAMPVFAAFCRGEQLSGQALATLDTELDSFHEALKTATDEDWLRLTPHEESTDPKLYRRSHFRGRTFDRRCVEPVPAEERSGFVVDLDLGQGDSLFTVFEPLMTTLRMALRSAQGQGATLQQRPSSFHRVPSATEW